MMKAVMICLLLLVATQATPWVGGDGLFGSIFGLIDLGVGGVCDINSAVTVTVDAAITSQGSIIVGDAGVGPAHLIFEASSVVNDLTVNIGSLVVETGKTVLVTGDLVVEAGVEIIGDVVVEGRVIVRGAATFGSESARYGVVWLNGTAEALIEDATEFYSSLKAEIGTKVVVSAGVDVECNGKVTIDADAEVYGSAGSSFTLKNTTNTLSGKFTGEADANLVVRGDLLIEATAEIVGNLIVEGKAIVDGTAKFGEETVHNTTVWLKTTSETWINAAIDFYAQVRSETNAKLWINADLDIHFHRGLVIDANAEIMVEARSSLYCYNNTHFNGIIHGEEDAKIVFRGDLLIDAVAELISDVVLEGKSQINSTAKFGEETARNTTVWLKDTSETWITSIVDFFSNVTAEANAAIWVQTSAESRFHNFFYLALDAQVNIDVTSKVSLRDRSEIEGELTGEGIVEVDIDSDLDDKALLLIGGVKHKVKTLLIKGKSKVETTKEVAIDGAVTLTTNAILLVKHKVNVTKELAAQGQSRVECILADLYVTGQTTFEDGVAYAVALENDLTASVHRLLCEEQVTIAGTIELHVAADYQITNNCTIMEHVGVSGSFSAIVEVRDGTRNESPDDYETNYNNNESNVARANQNGESSENNQFSEVDNVATILPAFILVAIALLV